MTYPAKLIRTDGTESDVTVSTSKQLAELIGATLVEVANTRAGVLIVDESGLLKERPRNEKATKMYGHEYIAGDVLLFTREAFEAFDRSLEP